MTEQKNMHSPWTTIRERYERDPAFRSLVSMMLATIERTDFTPTEIREAAMLAQIMYEDYHPRPIIFTREDVLKGKV